MGLFSSPPPLDEEIQAYINPMWTEAGVSGDYKTGISKVAGSQDTIRSTLRSGEYLMGITPCFKTNTGYQGLLVVTSDRVLQVKGRRIEKEIRRDDVADVKQFAHRLGFFMLQVISRQAAPFAPFASDGTHSQGGLKFWEGTIQVPLSTEELMDFAVMTIRPNGGS